MASQLAKIKTESLNSGSSVSKASSSKRTVPVKPNTKTEDVEEQALIPQPLIKFDGVTGCRITTKNKHMPDYKYIYPMLDPDGKVRLVTEDDFHLRVNYKHRGYLGYRYLYPVLNEDPLEVVVIDELLIVDGWDDRAENTFVPDDVDRMCCLGVYRIRKSPNTDDLFIVSNRGDIYLARMRQVEKRKNLSYDGDLPKPPIKLLLEVNGLQDVEYTKEQQDEIDEWRENMERITFPSFGGSKFSSFGAYLEPGEWSDESITDFFASNWPDESVENQENEEEFGDIAIETVEEKTEGISSTGRSSPGDVMNSSMEEEDSGYVERRKASCVSSRMSCDSFYSDEFKNSDDVDNKRIEYSSTPIEDIGSLECLKQGYESGDEAKRQSEDEDTEEEIEFQDCENMQENSGSSESIFSQDSLGPRHCEEIETEMIEDELEKPNCDSTIKANRNNKYVEPGKTDCDTFEKGFNANKGSLNISNDKTIHYSESESDNEVVSYNSNAILDKIESSKIRTDFDEGLNNFERNKLVVLQEVRDTIQRNV